MNLISTYYAVEIYEDGIWRKPACWMVDKKYISDRVKQLEKEGWKVRVKIVREYKDEQVVHNIEEEEKSICHYCKLNFPLEYFPGWGWFHFNSDGGPDIRCEDPEVQKRPDPEETEL